jgi:hypothetical protein
MAAIIAEITSARAVGPNADRRNLAISCGFVQDAGAAGAASMSEKKDGAVKAALWFAVALVIAWALYAALLAFG